MPVTNFMFTVTGANLPVTLNTPAILRSLALYVGPPPQANVTAPDLIQTLGTNSPLLTLPLAIANRGGLPLGCLLSVTNANPVVYGAINSTQPAGPVYLWKDYSAIGRDITTNFTALAPPKTSRDEGIAGPVNIGFAFPFFTNSFSQLYVSPNGFVTFTPFHGDASTNTSLPNPSAPLNSIAFFWDDLDINTSGHVYTFTDAINGTFTLQFQNVLFKGRPPQSIVSSFSKQPAKSSWPISPWPFQINAPSAPKIPTALKASPWHTTRIICSRILPCF